jgi:hypothetical protein
MARVKYRDWAPTTDAQERVLLINRILTEYPGMRVTVRQIYYRLVARRHIENNPREYDRVQDLLTKARYAGLIDWTAIEDRVREPTRMADWPSLKARLDEATNFRLDRWRSQHHYVELWVEKDALASVLEPVASDFHVTLMVNRGYSSASAMRDAALRLTRACQPTPHAPHGRRAIVLYIGDHDPSGLDMVRDVRERLFEFGVPPATDVRPIALTRAQIEEHEAPPNPTKVTDSRAAEYIAEFGHESWEVDALPPTALDLVARQHIKAYIDRDAMTAVITEEKQLLAKLQKFIKTFTE